MANTPHTSSPEKPERSMPQRHRTDPVLSIGTPPENCRNSSRDHELSGLRTVRSSFRTYATVVPPILISMRFPSLSDAADYYILLK